MSAGLAQAAQLRSASMSPGKTFKRLKISVDYTIEPTTDGKTMITARFQPN
jgi:hypothetical protein